MLRSYVQGAWHTAADEGRPLHDAVTGEEIARISSAGVDMAGVLEHGRRVGGPALRELTFHQRAGAAQGARRAPARAPRRALRGLRAHRRHARRLEVRRRRRHRRAARLRDARAARELPNDTVYVDGAVEPLGRGGTFVGQHICTPAARGRGAGQRVQLPGLGAAGEVRARVPGRRADAWSSRPARRRSSPRRLVELIVESGLLPEGTLQLVAGGVGDLFDHLTEQDLVSFTGSASTAADAAHAPGDRGRAASGSPPRPTRSTARSSAPTPRPARPSSTSTSRTWSPR